MPVVSSIDLKAMASLVQSMTAAATTLEGSAASIRSTSERVLASGAQARKLKTTASWVREQIPGLRRRLAMAQQIEAQTRGFQPVVAIDDSQISTLPPDIAIAKGAEAAKKLKEAGNHPSPELVAEIHRNQSDPYFAAGFARNITPSELGSMVRDMSRLRQGPRMDGIRLAFIQEWEQRYTQLLNGVGTTLATATRNTGELALPGDYATRWLDTITKEPLGFAASVVLRYGTFSTPFLRTVAAGVYDYERSLSGRERKDWTELHGTPRPLLPSAAGGDDPLANLLEGLSHNPQAAQDFFDVGNPQAANVDALPETGRLVNGRLAYLLQDRRWGAGDGLGHALEAATLEWRDQQAHGRISAEIAAQTFALVGTPMVNDSKRGMPVGHDSMAKIIASYMPSIFRMHGVKNPQADSPGGSWITSTDYGVFPPGQPFGVKLDPAVLAPIIARVGENESDIQIVAAGVLAAGQIRFQYALQKSLRDNPHTPVMMIRGDAIPLMENAGAQTSHVLSWVVQKGYAGDLKAEEAVKRQRELTAKTLGALASLPVFSIGTSVGEWTKYAIGELQSRAIEEIGKAPKGTAQQVYDEMDQMSQVALEDNARTLLLRSGYMRPEYFAAANKAAKGQTYVPPPPTALKGHSGPDGRWIADEPLEFDRASEAYRTWADSYGGNRWIRENINLPYSLDWPNKLSS
ncbi:hypothetical protein ACFCV3_39785 [Kribbella sp. NPDC056345]|uniref:hypothetical protein n=1 Tax=Kribbella sp. NPDC056345 TaxID=3345789 RepID=UPI0035DA5E51